MTSTLKTQRAEVSKFIEELLQATDPNLSVNGVRRFSRQDRSLPAVIFPILDDKLLTDKPLLATTKDLSTGGSALLLQDAFPWDDFAIVLPFHSMPVFVRSRVRHRTSLVFGFWQLGVEWLSLLLPDRCPALTALSSQLRRLSDCMRDQLRDA